MHPAWIRNPSATSVEAPLPPLPSMPPLAPDRPFLPPPSSSPRLAAVLTSSVKECFALRPRSELRALLPAYFAATLPEPPAYFARTISMVVTASQHFTVLLLLTCTLLGARAVRRARGVASMLRARDYLFFSGMTFGVLFITAMKRKLVSVGIHSLSQWKCAIAGLAIG